MARLRKHLTIIRSRNFTLYLLLLLLTTIAVFTVTPGNVSITHPGLLISAVLWVLAISYLESNDNNGAFIRHPSFAYGVTMIIWTIVTFVILPLVVSISNEPVVRSQAIKAASEADALSIAWILVPAAIFCFVVDYISSRSQSKA